MDPWMNESFEHNLKIVRTVRRYWLVFLNLENHRTDQDKAKTEYYIQMLATDLPKRSHL